MDPIWIIRGGLSILSLDKIDNPWIILGSSSVADRALIGCRLGADPDNPRSALEYFPGGDKKNEDLIQINSSSFG